MDDDRLLRPDADSEDAAARQIDRGEGGDDACRRCGDAGAAKARRGTRSVPRIASSEQEDDRPGQDDDDCEKRYVEPRDVWPRGTGVGAVVIWASFRFRSMVEATTSSRSRQRQANAAATLLA